MKRKSRRIMQIASTLAVAALAITGCSSSGGGDNSASGKTTIRFSYLWTGNEGKALQKIVDDYNSSQSKIHVVATSNPDTTKQLASMSSSNGSYDVSDNFGTNVGAWASKGIIEPLDDYKFTTNDFLPSVMHQMTYDNKLYAVPLAVQEYKLLYNKKLFKEAGISNPPTTMDEFAKDIAKLTKQKKDGTITQMGFGTTSPYDVLTTLGFVFGGQWDTNGKASPQNSKSLEALNWYQKNVTNKFGAKNIQKFAAGYGQYMSAQDPFYTGKVAMTIDGEWQSASIAKEAPKLLWGAASIPAASADLQDAGQTYNSMLYIPANSKHKAEAAEFIKYLTSPKAMTAFTVALGNLPARKSLLTSSAYDALPEFNVWLKGLNSPNLKAMDSAPYTPQYNSDLTTAFTNMLNGSQTPEQAMAWVAKRAATY